jgi:hypothetical protein
MIDGNNYLTLVTSRGPAFIVAIELDGPIQTFMPAAMTDEDTERLFEWLGADGSRAALVEAACLLRDGGSLIGPDIDEEYIDTESEQDVNGP